MERAPHSAVKYCFSFQRGACKRGDQCKYQHSVPPASSGESDGQRQVCYAYQKGECIRGETCKFSHDKHVEHCEEVRVIESVFPRVESKDQSKVLTDSISQTIQPSDEKKAEPIKLEKNLTINTAESANHEVSFPIIVPRPQIEVGGFEGMLTCCADWPQTKKGGPPGAQSAIFNPLLACTLGHIPGHCTPQQISYAISWWSEVFPAYPRWIFELQSAGLTSDSVEGKKLLGSISQPKKKKENNSSTITHSNNSNNLIYKHSKEIYGDVPHFRGKAQNEALELAPMVAVEVYACVTCLYSRSVY